MTYPLACNLDYRLSIHRICISKLVKSGIKNSVFPSLFLFLLCLCIVEDSPIYSTLLFQGKTNVFFLCLIVNNIIPTPSFQRLLFFLKTFETEMSFLASKFPGCYCHDFHWRELFWRHKRSTVRNMHWLKSSEFIW